MLPERLSTDLTSLNPGVDRLALVTEMVFNADGSLAGSTVYRARVRNQAKLAYDAVSAWIDGEAALPEAAAAVPGMEAQLRTQDALAQQLRARRHAQGSLELETFQPRALFEGEQVVDIRQQVQNRARQLIEEVMIATNGCTARYLAAQGGASLRRVVRSPERWLRIVGVAKEYGETLPDEPDSKALEAFLAKQHRIDPLRFPDLSLVIVKLMGRGEYVVETPGGPPIGHFGLAVRDYTHSTAPNRRFPDLITLRLLKAALAGRAAALHARPSWANWPCTAPGRKTPRRKWSGRCASQRRRCCSNRALASASMRWSPAPALSGIWVRIFTPPAEGKLVGGDGGPARGRQAPGQAGVGQRGARLYRLRAGGLSLQGLQRRDIRAFLAPSRRRRVDRQLLNQEFLSALPARIRGAHAQALKLSPSALTSRSMSSFSQTKGGASWMVSPP